MECTENPGKDTNEGRVKTVAYEEARVPGILTAERSGSTPSTAKRFRSMPVRFPTLLAPNGK